MNPRSTVSENDLKKITNAISRLRRSDVPTGILYHPLAHTLDEPKFSGQSEEVITLTEMSQALFELRLSAIEDEEIQDPASLRAAVRDARRTGEIPMVLASYDYQAVTRRAIKRFLVAMRADGDLQLDDLAIPEILELRQVRFCRPLVDSVVDGGEVTFSFKTGWRLANTDEMPNAIDFDPDDGHGVRHLSIGSRLPISYSTSGEKNLRVICHYEQGSTTTNSILRVMALDLPTPDETIKVNGREYRGVIAKGIMKVYYAPNHTNVVKPLFMWTGFNTGTATVLSVPTPFDVWDATAESLFAVDPNKLLEQARQAGYDIIVIEFDDSRTYIQSNAYMVENAIRNVNGRTTKKEQSVLVTGSMGGLVARYALLDMEKSNYDAEIETTIFLDSPACGAVVAMGIQYALDFFSDKVEEVRKLKEEILDSTAARQMLVQMYRPWCWVNQNEPKPDPLFVELQKEFDDLGKWPKKTTLYAVANGSNKARGQKREDGKTLEPAKELVTCERTDNHGGWKAGCVLRAMPDYADSNPVGIKVIEVGRVGRLNWSATVKKTLPWDSCPGGHGSFVRLFATNGWTSHKLYAGETCFIPTVSALGFGYEHNLYHIVPSNGTPFKEFYAPEENEGHASLNASNVQWIKQKLGIS